MNANSEPVGGTAGEGPEERLRSCLERLGNGERDAWPELLALNRGFLRGLALDHADMPGTTPEDRYQEICQGLLESLPAFTLRSLPEWRSWVRQVAGHRLTDMRRRLAAAKRAGEPAPGLESQAAAQRPDGREVTTPSRAAIRNEEDDSRGEPRTGGFVLTSRVRAALDRLDARDRTLLVEVRLKGRAIQEVMPEVGIAVYSTATAALARATRHLSNLLQEE